MAKRKLKLQMHISLDGFVNDSNGANFNWEKDAKKFSIDNLKNVDSILLGRKTAEGFIPYWAGVAANPSHEDHKIGKLLTDIPKIILSKKLKQSKWENATVINGNIADEIKNLKKKKGKDIIVYGGHSFVASLIQQGLIDEYYFLLNPVAFGSGEQIFNTIKKGLRLTLQKSRAFKCGTVLLCYTP